jgi:hypothetical protein
MRTKASHEIHPVKNAIQKPEKRPFNTEPMNALSIVLNAEAEGDKVHSDMVGSGLSRSLDARW